MLKLTHYDAKGMRSGELHIAKDHVVALSHGNPSGAVITCVRTVFHVAQSVDQVLDQMK